MLVQNNIRDIEKSKILLYTFYIDVISKTLRKSLISKKIYYRKFWIILEVTIMNKTTADQAMKESTMVLLYLARFTEHNRFSDSKHGKR